MTRAKFLAKNISARTAYRLAKQVGVAEAAPTIPGRDRAFVLPDDTVLCVFGEVSEFPNTKAEDIGAQIWPSYEALFAWHREVVSSAQKRRGKPSALRSVIPKIDTSAPESGVNVARDFLLSKIEGDLPELNFTLASLSRLDRARRAGALAPEVEEDITPHLLIYLAEVVRRLAGAEWV